LAGIVSVHDDELPPVPLLPPVHEETVPQLADSATLPPVAGTDVGLAESVHVVDPDPGSLQLTMMFPPEALAVKLELVHVSCAPNAGMGTANAARGAAAASTRLTSRIVFML
jgi:hypothetical protein